MDPIKKLRKSHGLTQIELCKKLGITQGYLSKIESGIAPMNIIVLSCLFKKKLIGDKQARALVHYYSKVKINNEVCND